MVHGRGHSGETCQSCTSIAAAPTDHRQAAAGASASIREAPSAAVEDVAGVLPRSRRAEAQRADDLPDQGRRRDLAGHAAGEDRRAPLEARSPAQISVRTVADYAEAWLAGRELKPRTRAEYRRILDSKIIPGLGRLELAAVTPAVVRAWYLGLDPAHKTAGRMPTRCCGLCSAQRSRTS